MVTGNEAYSPEWQRGNTGKASLQSKLKSHRSCGTKQQSHFLFLTEVDDMLATDSGSCLTQAGLTGPWRTGGVGGVGGGGGGVAGGVGVVAVVVVLVVWWCCK